MIDMILVVAGEDYKNIKKVIENSTKYINHDKIYIISPKNDIERNKDRLEQFHNLFLIDEKEIMDINMMPMISSEKILVLPAVFLIQNIVQKIIMGRRYYSTK